MGLEHKPWCVKSAFWDGGEFEVRCTCHWRIVYGGPDTPPDGDGMDEPQPEDDDDDLDDSGGVAKI